VVAVPGGASHRPVAQSANRVTFGIEFARRDLGTRRMQEAPVLSSEQKDQSVHQTKKLSKELRQRKRTGLQAFTQRRVV
jgi:hypothetical protein